MVNTPLPHIFQKTSLANNNTTGRAWAVNLTAAKLNDFGGGSTSNVLRLDGHEKFCQSSNGHVHGPRGVSTVVSNGVDTLNHL